MSSTDKDCILCSVCIANYNGEEYLCNCIDSVLEQDVDFLVEIIVHDDASPDNSIELIRAKYPDVRLIPSKENVGFCVSNNRMVDLAQGQFVLLLNNDAQLRQDALKTLMAAVKMHGDGIFGLPQYDLQTGKLIDIGIIFDPFLNPIPNLNNKRQDVGMITGGCLFLPRTLWVELGGFLEWFEFLQEDMYICCLARLKGYPVKAIAKSGFDHWVGRNLGGGKVKAGNRLSTTFRRRRLSERNKTFVMLICYPSISVWVVVPIHLFVLCLEGMILSLIKRDKRIWKEIYWNCIREVYERRRFLQKKRSQVQQVRCLYQMKFFAPFSIIPHKLRMMLKHGLPHVAG